MWLKLDDRFDEHPKLARCDDYDAALSVMVQLMLYCARNLTDGAIPKRVEQRFDRDIIAALMEPHEGGPGMLERGPDGLLLVHDYLDYNPSRADVESERERKREGGKKGAARRWGKGEPIGEPMAETPPDAIGISDAPVPVPVLDLDPRPKKTSPCLYDGIPDAVLGYFADKLHREVSESDCHSLRVLAKKYRPEVINIAIGQTVAQGESADNFALITTIAKREATP